MTDRDFWLIVYRALKMVLKAIERYYLGKEEEELSIVEKSHTPTD